MRPEVLVVGGGPSGAAAALALARLGRRVSVLEREAAPRHAVCGEFLSADALKIIAEDYQGGLLERLNDQVRGASKPVVSRTCV